MTRLTKRIAEGWLFASAVIDLFSRWVVGWLMSAKTAPTSRRGLGRLKTQQSKAYPTDSDCRAADY